MFFKWRYPLRPLGFLREREDTSFRARFSLEAPLAVLSLPKTLSLLPALPKGAPLWKPRL